MKLPEAPPEVPTGKRKQRVARGGGAGRRDLRPFGLGEVRLAAATVEDEGRATGDWRDAAEQGDRLSFMEDSGEQPGPQPPHPGDHRIRDGDYVVLKREDVFKAVQVQRRK